MEKTKDLWLKTFKDNYENKTPEAKELESYTKKNYKDNVYIPWATMERLTYQQDPDAEFLIIKNEEGGIVHTDKQVNHQSNIQKGEVISETTASMYSHMVIVSLTFLGKTFIETYPIQDKDYTSLKIYDQNSVNKALQRAKAKVASRATGLAYKLYEGQDLQFDEVVETKKPVLNVIPTVGKTVTIEVDGASLTPTPKKTKVKEGVTVVSEEPKVVAMTAEDAGKAIAEDEEEIGTSVVLVDEAITPEVEELYNLIHDTAPETIKGILQKLNVTVVKKYGFALNLEDDINKFNNKVSQFKDVTKFTSSIRNMLG